MQPIPPNKLMALALSRRKLFEKIVQHVATRKIQNSIQATGDRMSITPAQFGIHVGQQIKKSFVTIPATAGVGAGLGALTSPSGHRMEGAGRGAAKGTGVGLGATIGAPVGAVGTLALALMNPRVGKAVFGPSSTQLANYVRQLARSGKFVKAMRPGHIRPEQRLQLMNTLAAGGVGGAVGGGGLGYAAAGSALGKPSWESKKAGAGASFGRGLSGAVKLVGKGLYNAPRSLKTMAAGGAGGYYVGRQHGHEAGQEKARNDVTKVLADVIKEKMPAKKASVLSVLGGLTGGGLGGLAGGAGGGILGALGGGALGGAPGAGMGLLAGGAAGLGAGAHMGGNIGADIGRSFSKKKEKPENEKEEKSEEKSEDSGDEEVKKSAAVVLAQLQKNAAISPGVARMVARALTKADDAFRRIPGTAGSPTPSIFQTARAAHNAMTKADDIVAGIGRRPTPVSAPAPSQPPQIPPAPV